MIPSIKSTFIFLVFIFAGTFYSNSQNMIFDWATAYNSSPTPLYPQRLAVQNNGTTLMGARLISSMDADSGPGVTMVNKNHTSGHIYISYDADGQFLWANKLESDNLVTTTSMVASPNGDFYVVGNFRNNLIATVSTVEQTIADTGSGSGFLAKFNAIGQIEYIKNFSGIYAENYAVDIDGAGNVYIGGYFYDALFNPSGSNETSNYLDVFVVKLNSDGDFQWIYRTEGDVGQMPDYFVNDIKVDSNGNINLFGSYTESNSYNLDFEQGAGVTEVSSTDELSSFILQLNSSGNFNWVKTFIADTGTTSREVVSVSMELDSNNNIYMYGSALGLVAFDDANPTDKTDFTTPSTRGIFLVKLNQDGDFVWLNTFQLTGGYLELSQITVDTNDDILITGNFYGSIDFDATAGENILSYTSSGGGFNAFFAKYQSNGALIEAINIGRNDASDTAHDIAADGFGNMYGVASSATTSPSNLFLGNMELTGDEIRYIYKIRPCGAESVTQIDGATLRSNFSNASYQWLDCNNDNTPISGEINPTFTPTVLGSYALKTTSYNCGPEISSCFNVAVLSTNDFTKALNVFPNPTDGIVSIDLGTIHSNLNVTLVNSLGQKISSKFYNSIKQFEVLLPNEPSIYFIQLNDNKKITTLKVIKK
ncbi:T9SS type A sorting domain-containing protein [Mariniflexile sp. HNIBRBA6329]|uniref:T9SS type A sorting domain-containing protein n=1 Tax=Mariniflexile sp. HNIBRBA6329 TaxID=3373088 RepID=UPI00374630F8